jgi:hypothetical protein
MLRCSPSLPSAARLASPAHSPSLTRSLSLTLLPARTPAMAAACSSATRTGSGRLTIPRACSSTDTRCRRRRPLAGISRPEPILLTLCSVLPRTWPVCHWPSRDTPRAPTGGGCASPPLCSRGRAPPPPRRSPPRLRAPVRARPCRGRCCRCPGRTVLLSPRCGRTPQPRARRGPPPASGSSVLGHPCCCAAAAAPERSRRRSGHAATTARAGRPPGARLGLATASLRPRGLPRTSPAGFPLPPCLPWPGLTADRYSSAPCVEWREKGENRNFSLDLNTNLVTLVNSNA